MAQRYDLQNIENMHSIYFVPMPKLFEHLYQIKDH